jgi:hypothetical protein
MSFAARGTLLKGLHPDLNKLPEAEREAARDAALKVVTAWMNSLKPA